MKVYEKSAESGDGPAWVCGHWNGSPVEIGIGHRSEVGDGEVWHHHFYREYYVMLDGAAELKVEEEVVELRPGTVVMVEPGENHMVTAVADGGASWVVIGEQSAPNSKHLG